MVLSLWLSAACGSAQAGGAGGGGTAASPGNASSGGASTSGAGRAGITESCDDLACVDGRIELASCPGKPFAECDREASGVECVVSGACPKLPDGVGGEVGPSSALQFCQAWVDAFAGFMQRCACDAQAVARYREWSAALCDAQGPFGGLNDAVLAGDFSYHSDAAARLFARLKSDQAPCVEEPFRALRLDSEELYSLAGSFVGTHSLGEACRHPVGYKGGISDCRDGYCADDGAGAGVCIAFVGKGAECDASGDDRFQADVPRLCHEVRPPDSDGEYESSFATLACVPAAPGSSTRICAEQLADGTACHSYQQCRSGRCVKVGKDSSGECMPKIADGEPCQNHTECASGACSTAEPRVCGPLLADNEPCAYSQAACASGYCNSEIDGVAAFCAPPPTRLLGESCSAASDCVTDTPGGSRGNLCQAGQCVNDICAAYTP
ncbi:MAG TPA: hypothetical protein VFK05_27460 [Polyangiaceae bacterium]|nr:hypothetical protein [Polyangiaceae bacterium]